MLQIPPVFHRRFAKIRAYKKDELPYCFPEFEPYLGNCRFTSCSHTSELGCAVLEAVNEGKIENQDI